ncbi:MAG: molybdopterin-dependent oxidoreductase [Bacteroidales bacterium]|jgi:anaerobic selenocysteine-containing dehydrogenase|nr:molybdopterin-dependent oxidoreductase [Bacteroidales bacterium]
MGSKRVYTTACPRNCYSTCSFKVWTDNGKVINIDPQPLNQSTSEGICLKGLSYVERVNSPKRILHPLKKVNGNFIQISWEAALTEIAEKLTHYKSNYSPQSVLFYYASGMSGLLNSVSINFWRMFGGATTVYGNLCWPAGLEATRLTLGENKHNVTWDLENAKLIVVWGKNPAESNIQQMIPIERAQQKGASLIFIDPRRTASTERADLLIQPIPGTDGILALTIANFLIEKNLIDHQFIETHVLGFDKFKDAVLKIDIDEASKECGVSVPFIEKLADQIGTIKPMTLIPGYGMQRYTNGGQTTRCLLALSIITGNIGKPGSCWHYADLQSDIFSHIKEPVNYFPPEKPDGIFRREIATARLGEDMLRLSNPELKMAWVERGNPLTQNPDSNKVKEAFRNLEYRVVVEQFMTDTALEADIVLPAKTMFEQSDIISSYWNPYVQLRQKVIDPLGEVKPETEIYYLLAKKLGFDEEEIKKNIPFPTDEAIEKWLDEKLKPFPELTIEKLKLGPILTPGLQEIAFSDFKFKTPSGKIELFSETAHQKWGVNQLPSYNKLIEGQGIKDQQYPFNLMSPNTKNRIHSQFGNLESIKAVDPEPFATINLGDAAKKGIEDHDLIRVYNDRGELTIKSRIDASLRPGNIVIVNGYWHQEGSCPNILSKGRETDMGHGSAFHDNMVNYEKVSG